MLVIFAVIYCYSSIQLLDAATFTRYSTPMHPWTDIVHDFNRLGWTLETMAQALECTERTLWRWKEKGMNKVKWLALVCILQHDTANTYADTPAAGYVVYFALRGGLVLIGRTKNVQVQLKRLQRTADTEVRLLGTPRSDVSLKAVLMACAALRDHGQWYRHTEWLDIWAAGKEDEITIVDPNGTEIIWSKGIGRLILAT